MSIGAVALLVGVLAVPRIASGAQGDCSQPVSAGASPVASDCLFILRVAVALQACTPQACVCDPTGDGNTTASDALTCLKKAVGEPTTLLCPCGTTADCTNDGTCRPFQEGCVCEDCTSHPECVDN